MVPPQRPTSLSAFREGQLFQFGSRLVNPLRHPHTALPICYPIRRLALGAPWASDSGVLPLLFVTLEHVLHSTD